MNDAATARSGAAVLFELLFVLIELLYWRREITADRVVPLSPLLVLSAASLVLKWLANPLSWANRASIASIPFGFRRSYAIA